MEKTEEAKKNYRMEIQVNGGKLCSETEPKNNSYAYALVILISSSVNGFCFCFGLYDVSVQENVLYIFFIQESGNI